MQCLPNAKMQAKMAVHPSLIFMVRSFDCVPDLLLYAFTTY